MIDYGSRIVSVVLYCTILGGCASGAKLLPDDGPTTAAIWAGDTHSVVKDKAQQTHHALRDQPEAHDKTRETSRSLGSRAALGLLASPASMSATSTSYLETLNQDFREIPNPQIIAYVYPHFNKAELPVPGYFTAFHLYRRSHYAKIKARAEEGLNQ